MAHDYNQPEEEVVVGEFYLGFYCKTCNAPILLFHDPNRGKTTLSGEGKMKTTCHSCNSENLYGTAEVQSFLARPEVLN